MAEPLSQQVAVPQAAPRGADGLRDLQLPEPVGWWPPAPGWWLLLGLALLFALALLVGPPLLRRWRAWRSRRGWLQAARGELHQLRDEAVGADPAARAAQVVAYSRLLRRVALAVRSREEVAALTGERWLALLDELAGEPLFGGEVGHLLLETPYRPPGAIVGEAELVALQSAARHLLKRLAAGDHMGGQSPGQSSGQSSGQSTRQSGRNRSAGPQQTAAVAGDA